MDYSNFSNPKVGYTTGSGTGKGYNTPAQDTKNGEPSDPASQSAQDDGNGVRNIPGIPTFENNSGATVWLKPEDNLLGSVSLANGKSTSMRIDGVTHPKYIGQVFKVVDWVDVVFGVKANSWSVFVNSHEGMELNQIGGGGWLSDPPEGWHDIFLKAGWKAP